MKYLLILPLLFCGCTSLNRNMVQSVDGAVNLVVPNYIEYVEKDDKISDELKQARINHAKQLLETIKDAKKLAGVE